MTDEVQEDTKEPKQPLSRSERFRNYLIGLGAISALVLGLVAQFKGEPVAEKAYEVLRANQNKQAKELNRIRTRLIYFQAYQEAGTAVKLQSQLEALQKKYDAAMLSKAPVAISKVSGRPRDTAPKPVSACKDGGVRGADKKCHRVRRTILARVKTDARQAKEAKRRLLHETKRRMAAERKKRELMRKLRNRVQQTEGADLPALPKKLEDVTQKK